MADIAWTIVIPEEISKKLFEDEGIDFVEIFIKDRDYPEIIMRHYFESPHLDPERLPSNGYESIKSKLYEECLEVKTEIGRKKATKVYNMYGWWLSVTCSMSCLKDDLLPEDIESRLDSAVEWAFR